MPVIDGAAGVFTAIGVAHSARVVIMVAGISVGVREARSHSSVTQEIRSRSPPVCRTMRHVLNGQAAVYRKVIVMVTGGEGAGRGEVPCESDVD